MFIEKGVLKICSKFTGEHPCRSEISIKLLCNFFEITLRHGYSPVNLLHILRIPFPVNTSWWWLLLRENLKRLGERLWWNLKQTVREEISAFYNRNSVTSINIFWKKAFLEIPTNYLSFGKFRKISRTSFVKEFLFSKSQAHKLQPLALHVFKVLFDRSKH